jgi:hypothetical protein
MFRMIVATALTVFLATFGTSGTAAAQPPASRTAVGSWVETVTFPAEVGRPPLKSLVTFHADGTTTCSDQGAVSTIDASVFTSCHGVWKWLQGSTLAYTQLELISDLSGNLVGHLKVRGVYTLSASGNEYDGVSHAEVILSDGTVVFSSDVANAGTRIQLELP